MLNLPQILSRTIIISSLLIFEHAANAAAVPVLQRGYTAGVVNANLNETTLTTSNVSSSTFGRLFSLPVDAGIYAQPLYVPNLAIPGQGTHNVLFVATMKDSIYAFDADTPAAPLWAINYANSIPGAQPAPITDYVGTNSLNIAGPVGIESTPIIDPTSNTMYFVTNTREVDNLVFRLHAIDITTGAEKFGGPVVISGSYTANGSTITFSPGYQNQRASLALAKGQVIIGFGSHEDEYKYYGWVMAYNAQTLAQTGIFSPGATLDHGAAIWQTGRPPVVDSSGDVYVFVGNSWGVNGSPLTADGVYSFSESLLKLDPAQGLAVVDYFTPSIYQEMDANDLDLSSSGPTLIPGGNVLVGGGKPGTLYAWNTQNLGKLTSNDSGALQAISGASSGEIRGGPAYWARSTAAGGPLIFNWGAGDALKAFSYNAATSQITAQPVAEYDQPPLIYPGGELTLSANGDQQGIVWALIVSEGDADHRVAEGELHALNAANVSQPLWSSTTLAPRDDLGLLAKWVPPVVSNGKVYVATSSKQVVVYGLLPTSGAATVTAWPPQQPALGGSASYIVEALAASGSAASASWTVSGLPPAASGVFQTDAHGRTVLQVTLGAATPIGSYRLQVTADVGGVSTTQAVLMDVPDSTFVTASSATADSHYSANPPKLAIDNNLTTFWETQYGSSAPAYPHDIVLDLGKVQAINGLTYIPRQDGCLNGTEMQYEVYLSTDGVNWQTQSAGGSFDYGPNWRSYQCNGSSFPQAQNIAFPVTSARYVKLNALGALADGTAWAAAAEVKAYLAKGSVPWAGDYVLTARHDGLVMDAGKDASGVTVTQEDYSDSTSQQWQISATKLNGVTPSAGYYFVKSLESIAANNNLTLDVAGANKTAGSLLEQWSFSGHSNQQFKFTPYGDGRGFYSVTNLNSGMCNDVTGAATGPGVNIEQWTCSYSYNQLWWLSPANPSLP